LSTNDGLITDLDAYLLIKERTAKRESDKGSKGRKGDVRSQKTLTKNRDWVQKEVTKGRKRVEGTGAERGGERGGVTEGGKGRERNEPRQAKSVKSM
jgi:hypothetical protein